MSAREFVALFKKKSHRCVSCRTISLPSFNVLHCKLGKVAALVYSIDPLHKWRLHLNNNTLYILSITFMFQDKNFHMNVRLRMYEYCYSNLGAIYTKGLYNIRSSV